MQTSEHPDNCECRSCMMARLCEDDRTTERKLAPLTRRTQLPDDAEARKEYPMATGLLDYFPAALAEVARLSRTAVKQHRLDGLYWKRDVSTEHADKIIRHLVDRGGFDDKGVRHSAAVAWRALALLQEELEEAGAPRSRASR